MDTKIEVVKIPNEFVELAEQWHDGQDSMFYALSSTGELKLGTIRPYDQYIKRYLTDQEWHVSLWSWLACDVRFVIKSLKKTHEDYITLQHFDKFCEQTVLELKVKYGLLESEVV